MAEFDEEELQRILKPIGMYRSKAKKYHSHEPGPYGKIRRTGAGGSETSGGTAGVWEERRANVVMSVGFGHPRIAVDTHVFRVSNRIGLVDEKDVLSTEKALMETIPREQWTVNHHRLIWHGRMICTARNPQCDTCPLTEICLKKAVIRRAEMYGNMKVRICVQIRKGRRAERRKKWEICHFNGCDVSELASEYGTPLYIISEENIRERCREMKSEFLDRYENTKAVYASKACQILEVLRIIASRGHRS